MKISANLIESLIDPGDDGDQWQHKFSESNHSDILTSVFALVDTIRKGDCIASHVNKTTNLSNYLNWITSLRSYVGELSEQRKANNNCARVCSSCKDELKVPFYRCSNCSDFLLCSICEIHSEEIHDHVFMKIKKQKNVGIGSSNLESISKFLDKFHSSLSTLLEDLLTSDLAKALEFGENNSIVLSDPESILNVAAGRVITKIWKIRNNGSCDWNENTKLKWLSGLTALDSRKSIDVPSLKSGGESNIWVDFKIPSEIKSEQIYESNWRLCNEKTEFGRPFCFKIRAIPNSTNSVECSSSSIDESIKYPPCFDLSIPFKSEVHSVGRDATCEATKKDQFNNQSQDKVDPPSPKLEHTVTDSVVKKQQSNNRSIRSGGRLTLHKMTGPILDINSSIMSRRSKKSSVNTRSDPKRFLPGKFETSRPRDTLEVINKRDRWNPFTRRNLEYYEQQKMASQKDPLQHGLDKLRQMAFCNVDSNTKQELPKNVPVVGFSQRPYYAWEHY